MPKPPVIGPLLPFPDDLVDSVYKKAAKKTAYYTAFTGIAVAFAPRFPAASNAFLELTVGLSVTAQRVVKVKPLIVLNLLPEPIGVINPVLFDLPPDFGDPSKILKVVTDDGGFHKYFGDVYESMTESERKRARQVAEQVKTKTFSDLISERDQFNDNAISGDLGPRIRQVYADEIEKRQREAKFVGTFKGVTTLLTPEQIALLKPAQLAQFQADRQAYLKAVEQQLADQNAVVAQMEKDTGKLFTLQGVFGPKKDGGAMAFLAPEQYTDAAREVIAELIYADEVNRLNPADP